MHLDCRNYPKDYTFAQQASVALGIYVKIAAFTVHKDKRIFRMIVDPEIDRAQLTEILTSTIRDETKTYSFAYMEPVVAPIIDDTAHTKKDSSYLRLTFL